MKNLKIIFFHEYTLFRVNYLYTNIRIVPQKLMLTFNSLELDCKIDDMIVLVLVGLGKSYSERGH